MENLAAKVTAAYFDSRNLHYEVLGEDSSILRAGFTMDNRDGIKVLMFFDDDSKACKLRAFEVAKFAENKKEKMYQVCNALNAKYRWIKFFVDEEDNTITAEDDAVIQLDTCGEEVFQCCLQLVNIVDAAYPDIMRGIFA
jgi:hypothetical protein